jgi:Ca2+-binding EF-hand superfamily protein
MRKMGQNISFNEESNDLAKATEKWFSEGASYDFSAPGTTKNCGHFTALVWYDTTHVGIAQSKCGKYIVANFYPPGNWQDTQQYQMNVLPVDTPFAFRPRNKFEKILVEKFEHLAKGGNMISAPELENIFRSLGENKLADAVKTADQDGDGKVNVEEFVISQCQLQHSDEGNAKELENKINRVVGFLDVDSDGNGRLDEAEFVRYLTSLPGGKSRKPEEVHELLKRFDKDGDGFLDYDELLALLDSDALSAEAVPINLDKWTEDVKKMLAKVPDTNLVLQLKEHLQKGKKAQVTLVQPSEGAGSIVIKLFIGNKAKILKGEWGRTEQKLA